MISNGPDGMAATGDGDACAGFVEAVALTPGWAVELLAAALGCALLWAAALVPLLPPQAAVRSKMAASPKPTDSTLFTVLHSELSESSLKRPLDHRPL